MSPSLQSALDRLAAATTELRAASEAVLAAVSPDTAGLILVPAPDAFIPKIVELTAGAFGITQEELLGRSRAQQYVQARQVAMTLCHTYCPISLDRIGRAIGGRDHGTVLWSIEQVRNHCYTNSSFAAFFSAIDANVRICAARQGVVFPDPKPETQNPKPAKS